MPTLWRSLALGGLLYAAGVGAQVTGTITGVSDYRYRGVSLSRERPAAQLTIAYDDPGGGYGGLFASTVAFAAASARTLELVGFAGIAIPLSGELHADAGIDYAAFGGNLRDYDYGEVYAGVSSRDWSVRLHYSPDYFGVSGNSLYGEIDLTHPIGERVALIGHLGLLVPTAPREAAPLRSNRDTVDARAGVALDVAGLNLQIVWVSTNAARTGYPITRQRGDTVVFSVSRMF